MSVLASYSRSRVSNDNPFSEAQIRTLKYRSNYPQYGFETIDDARIWVSIKPTVFMAVRTPSSINISKLTIINIILTTLADFGAVVRRMTVNTSAIARNCKIFLLY